MSLRKYGRRVREKEEHNRHRQRGEAAFLEGQPLGASEHHFRTGSSVTCKAHHLRAMVESRGRRPESQRVAKQEAATATDLEQPILGPQPERREDRAACEVVHVVSTIDLAGPATSGSPGDAIGQPVIEALLGQRALLPGSGVVLPPVGSFRAVSACV